MSIEGSFENKIETNNEDLEYNFEFFKQVEDSVEAVVKEMKENFEKGKYDIILSDDTGSRILTLIFKKIADGLSEEDESLETYFVAAGRGTAFKKKSLNTKAEKQRNELLNFFGEKCADKNVLLISEYAQTGETINNFSGMLNGSGVANLDIVILKNNSLDQDKFEENMRPVNQEADVFIGPDDSSGGSLLSHKSEKISGVKKDTGELYEQHKVHNSVHPTKKEDVSRDDMREAREDADLVAQRVLKSIKEEK